MLEWLKGVAENVVVEIAVIAIMGLAAYVWRRWLIERARKIFDVLPIFSRERGSVPVRSQLKECITSSFPNLDCSEVASAIKQRKAIREVGNTFYRTDDVHWRRRFLWVVLLSGNYDFVDDAFFETRKMIMAIDADLGFFINNKNALYSKNVGDNTLRGKQIIPAKYDEPRDKLSADLGATTIAIRNARVAIFETALYSNRILIKAINYLRKESANPVGVWALFDARCNRDRWAGVNGVPVHASYTVDLGFVDSRDVGDRKVIPLSYEDQ